MISQSLAQYETIVLFGAGSSVLGSFLSLSAGGEGAELDFEELLEVEEHLDLLGVDISGFADAFLLVLGVFEQLLLLGQDRLVVLLVGLELGIQSLVRARLVEGLVGRLVLRAVRYLSLDVQGVVLGLVAHILFL